MAFPVFTNDDIQRIFKAQILEQCAATEEPSKDNYDQARKQIPHEHWIESLASDGRLRAPRVEILHDQAITLIRIRQRLQVDNHRDGQANRLRTDIAKITNEINLVRPKDATFSVYFEFEPRDEGLNCIAFGVIRGPQSRIVNVKKAERIVGNITVFARAEDLPDHKTGRVDWISQFRLHSPAVETLPLGQWIRESDGRTKRFANPEDALAAAIAKGEECMRKNPPKGSGIEPTAG